MSKLATSHSLLTILIVSCLSVTPASARMYQWTNPATGTVQLSGTPPAWYRSTSTGPRVLVFDNGSLIDDTAVEVAEAHRQSLRTDAFGETELELAAKNEIAPQDTLREALENAASDGVDVTEVAESFVAEKAEAEQGSVSATVEETVAQLKSLLDAWDSRRVDEAKALIRDVTGAGLAPTTPP